MNVDSAVKAAHTAFDNWRRTTLPERVAIIQKYKELVAADVDALALSIASEVGKPLWDAKTEAQAVVGKIDLSLKAHVERTPDKTDGASMLRHKPHGVAAVFGPYNFPAHLPNGHIVPALIAGNTIVFKPSDYTPKTAEWMALKWKQAGLPEGVLNVVHGGPEVGKELAAHPLINAILFTGSVEVGTLLHKQFAGRLDVMLALELGGNNPLIVEEMADMKAATLLMIQSAFITSGQRCTCARRLYVPEGAWGDTLLKNLCDAASRLKRGVYTDTPEPFMGPLISEREANKVKAGYDGLVGQGGKPLLAMTQAGAMLSPGIVDVSTVSNVEDREFFGPLLRVWRVRNLDEAIAKANDTKFGLSAGIISDSQSSIDQFLRDIRAGVVSVNKPTTGASGAMPFGGIGLSGNHRPSAYYAADYCAYPMAAQTAAKAEFPATLPIGVTL